jgi:hypothetical protein
VAAGVAAVAGLVLALLAVVLAAVLASMALRDFVAPLQVVSGLGCGEALRLFAGLVRAHPGVFLVYVILKVAFMAALAIAALVAGCCTCCIGFLPVVAQTVLQPAYYFERAWPLFVLRRLGYDAFAALTAPPAVP